MWLDRAESLVETLETHGKEAAGNTMSAEVWEGAQETPRERICREGDVQA